MEHYTYFHINFKHKTMKKIILSAVVLLLMSCAELQQVVNQLPQGTSGIGNEQIAQGLREALNMGIDKQVNKLALENGFFKNELVKILLPEELQKVDKTLRDIGLSSLADEGLRIINRAAEDGVLHSVHFTDQNTAVGEDDGMKSTASLSFKFRLPKGAQSVDKLEEIVALAIKYIDVCHDVSIPASVRERNLKKRKEVALSIVKENSRERAAKKREEDMRRSGKPPILH